MNAQMWVKVRVPARSSPEILRHAMSHTVGSFMRLVCDRLNSLMAERKLTRQQLADALSTKVTTVDSWRYAKRTPPSVVIALLDLIENESRVRARLGLRHKRGHCDKGGFKPGNPWRFNSETRPQALKEARARRKKAKAKD